MKKTLKCGPNNLKQELARHSQVLSPSKSSYIDPYSDYYGSGIIQGLGAGSDFKIIQCSFVMVYAIDRDVKVVYEYFISNTWMQFANQQNIMIGQSNYASAGSTNIVRVTITPGPSIFSSWVAMLQWS